MSSIFASGDAGSMLSAMGGGTSGAGFEQWFQNYQHKKIADLNKQILQKQKDTLADPNRIEAIDETEKDLTRIKTEADSLDILQRKSKSRVSNLKSYNTNSAAYMALKAQVHGIDPVTHKAHVLTTDEANQLNSYRNLMLSSLKGVKNLSLGRDFKTEFQDAYDTNGDAPDNEKVVSFNSGPWNMGVASGRKKLEALMIPKSFKAGSTMVDQISKGNIAAGGTGSEGDQFATYVSLHLDNHVKFALEQDSQFNVDVKHAVAHIAYMKNSKENALKRLPRDHLSSSEVKKLTAIADKLKSDLGTEMTSMSDRYDRQTGLASAALSQDANPGGDDQFNQLLTQMNKEDDDYYDKLMDGDSDAVE